MFIFDFVSNLIAPSSSAKSSSSKNNSTEMKCLKAFSQINQEWKDAAKAEIIYSSKDIHERTPELEKTIASYDLETMIKKINQLRAEGKKICLFIGRTPHEKLPSDLGEALDDEVWVSGDVSILPTEHDKEIEDITNKIYMWLDFTDPKCLKLINGLFDKVVVDASTEKVFGTKAIKNFALLLHDSSSQFITRVPPRAPRFVEFRTGRYQITFDALNQNTKELDKEFEDDIDNEEYGIKQEKFMDSLIESDMTDEFKEYYGEVSLVEAFYPYDNPFYCCAEKTKTLYFVASGVKRE